MVIDLDLPQTLTDQGQRMAAIVGRHPKLGTLFARLQALEDKRPDVMTGVIATIIAAIEVLDQQNGPPPPNPPVK